MKEIDWSKAPEGATHYGITDRENMWLACWHKKIDGKWYGWLADRPDQWDRNVFKSSRRHRARVMSLIEKPVLTDREAEQIAAEERRKAIDELANFMQRSAGVDCISLAAELHDAGYRKQVTP